MDAVELRNVKFYEKLSEETNFFTADVYFNGKKIAYAKNQGQGGNTDVRMVSQKIKDEFIAAEMYAKLLPPVKVGKGMTLAMDLENLVDTLFDKWLQKGEVDKTIKKIDKLTDRQIIILDRKKWEDFKEGKVFSISYKHVKFKGDLRSYSPKALRKSIQSIVNKLQPGEFIYNDLSFLDNIYEPVVDTDATTGWPEMSKALELNMQRLKEIDRAAKDRGEILYRFFSTPVADGSAFYQVVQIKGKKALVFLCDGVAPDNYSDRTLGGESWMELKAVSDIILGNDKFEKIWNTKKPKSTAEQ